jgi:hypothetical protein
MTKKKLRNKEAKTIRKLFKIDFISSFKCAKTNKLPLSLVHPSLKREHVLIEPDVEHIYVQATNNKEYLFVNGYLW